MNNPPKPLGSVQKGAFTFPNKSFVSKSVPNNVTKVTMKIMLKALVQRIRQ